tara:strand:+ start:5726 stop:6124 length:399 start_codon:yes stop_codon:yes gene_type:complete
MKQLTIILILLFSLSMYSQSGMREDHKKHAQWGAGLAFVSYSVALSSSGGDRLKAVYYSMTFLTSAAVGQEWISMWENPANHFDYVDVSVTMAFGLLSIAITDLTYHFVIKPLVKKRRRHKNKKLEIIGLSK